MKVFSLVLLITFLLSCSALTYAQQPCALKESPELRGFRLGMTVMEARGNVEDTTTFDISISANKAKSFTIRISGAELKEALAEGIDEINLSFVDGKLAVVKATYNGAENWDSGQDFLVKESASLGLPKPTSSTQTGGRGNEKYRIECRGFAVSLVWSFGVSPNVTVNDMAAQRLNDQRLEDEKDSKSIYIGPSTTTGPGRRP
jgi:hypothetical protein